MKYSKEEWKALSDRLMLDVRPTQYAVAMKFVKTQEELDAIPNVTFCKNKASVCKLIGMAAHFKGTFGLTLDHFSGYHCAVNNGCQAPTQEYLDGSILWKAPTPWHHDQEDSKKHIATNLALLPEKPFVAIVCSNLANCDIEEADVISLQLPSQAAFHLLAGYVESDYEMLNFSFRGESNCIDTWMQTRITGKPGLSLGCRGDRATGALGYGEVRVTMTTEGLVKALTGVETANKNGIEYPYNPTCLYADAF